MDLSLRGSQINLVSRQKPKAANVKYSGGVPRPGSASLFRKGRSSPFFKRPQSADAQFSTSNSGSNPIEGVTEGRLIRDKQFTSLSSSNILKLLIEEPIKRSWLAGDEKCTLNTTKATSSNSVSKNSADISSQEGESTASTRSSANQYPKNMNPSSSISNLSKTKLNQDFDYWNTKTPDLPGRVSFGKAPESQTLDVLSDCENEKQSFFSYGGKKTVHFGVNSEVHSETYEYPKCPSENCTCSTRSSSTVSAQDHQQNGEYSSGPCCSKTFDRSLQVDQPSPENGNEVILQYKSVIGEQSSECSSIVKNILQDLHPNNSPLNNIDHLPPLPAFNQQEKQNNLSEVNNKNRNLTIESYEQAKRNLVVPITSTEAESSASVINNYLKVSASPIVPTKKRVNNRLSSAFKQRRSKSASGSESYNHFTSRNTARQDTNLNAFQMDKVDSWMSMQIPNRGSVDDLERCTKGSIDGDEDSSVQEGSHTSKSEDNSQDDSTYDEIVSVIKEIEEDKKKENYAQKAEETDLKLNEVRTIQRQPSISSLPRTPKSPDKYRDILSYLDDVESSCDKALLETRRSIPESNRSEIEFVVEPDITEDVPKLSDLLMLPNHQLARRVIALSLRANELANAVVLSKEHLSKLRDEKQKGIRNEKQNTSNRLKEQKKHFEAIISRHQGFIEQLLKDKGSLCEKVAALTRRLESQNQAWEHKLDVEVARVKETTLAGEKIRRERWVRDNTKKIKELTVKGLEAEINKMTNDHQREVVELKRIHQQQLVDTVEELRQKHDQSEKAIREMCTTDREEIIEKERIAIRERYERQLEEERQKFDDEKAKLSTNLTAERERHQKEVKEKDLEVERLKKDILKDKEEVIQRATMEMNDKIRKMEENYQARVNSIERQFKSDFEIWKQEFENETKLRQVENENVIRQRYRTERDRQIDAIVSRMDSESLKQQEEFEAKIERLKEKYEKDLRQVESTERSLREKYTDTRSRLAESDAQLRNCEAELKQLHLELEHSKKMCDDILMEREQLRDNIRSEVAAEVATIKTERDNEIQQIHKRVQQAIEKKDTTIALLQKESGALRERCIKLEAIIRQQRKDYCIK